MESSSHQSAFSYMEKVLDKEKKGDQGRQKTEAGSKVFCCEQCGKVAKTKQALERHAAYHNSDRPFECRMCGQCFKNSDDLGKHLRRLRKDGKMEHACRVCHKHFKSEAMLQKHVEMLGCKKQEDSGIEHETVQTLTVKETRDKYQAEVTSSTSGEDLKCFCKDCELEFPSTLALKNHYKEMHEDRRRQVCLKCGQTLSSMDSLMRHYNIFHQSDFPYQCEYCQQKFKVKESLCRHIKFVHKDGGYKCDICERIFSQPVNLKKHMAVHSTLKEFSCETCGKEFRWKQSLQKHMLLHATPDDVCHKQVKRPSRVLRTSSKDTDTSGSYCQSEIQCVDNTSERNDGAVDKRNRAQLTSDGVHETNVAQEFENKLTSEVREIDCYTEEFQRLVETFSEETLDNTDLSAYNFKDQTQEYKPTQTQERVTQVDTGLKRKSDQSEETTDDFTQSKKLKKNDDFANKEVQPFKEFATLTTLNHEGLENSFVSEYVQNEPKTNEDENSGQKDDPEDMTAENTSYQQNNETMKQASYSSAEASPCVELNTNSDEGSTSNSCLEVKSHEANRLMPTASECAAPTKAYSPKGIEVKPVERPSSVKMVFKPSSISSIFAPESCLSSAGSPLSDSRDTVLHANPSHYQETSTPDTGIGMTAGKDLDHTNISFNELNTKNAKANNSSINLPLKHRLNRSASSPSPSGFGKFSLIKHMLSLQSEENFDKSLFVNPFYSCPGKLKSLHKMADKHKFSNGKDEFNCSSKHNIPFQWLGLSIRKEQKKPEINEEIGEKETNTISSLRQNTRHIETTVASEKEITSTGNGLSEKLPVHSKESLIETYGKNVAIPRSENSESLHVFQEDRYLNHGQHNTNSFSDSYNLDVLDLTNDFPGHERRDSEGQVSVQQSLVGNYKHCQSLTLPGTRSGVSESEAINLSTKYSVTNHLEPIEHFHPSHPSLSNAKKFNGFEAMKHLVKHSQDKQDRQGASHQRSFSSLTSPFDTFNKRVDSVSYGSSAQHNAAHSAVPHNLTCVSKSLYHSYNNLLNSNYPSSSSSSSPSSSTIGHPSSPALSSSVQSTSSFPAYSEARTTNSLDALPSVQGCNNPVSPFTALVSVASSIHQSKYQQAYHAIQQSGHLFSGLHMSASDPRMSQNPVTNTNQHKVYKSRHEIRSDEMMVDESRVGPIFPTKPVNDVSILDILQAPEYRCVGV